MSGIKISVVFAVLLCSSVVWAQRSIAEEQRLKLAALQKYTEALYREPTKKELEAVAPNEELKTKYAEFLRQPNSGLIKLIKDKNCAENTKIVSADENCLKYSMPGAGNSFSFRKERYRIARLADLTFTGDSFQGTGFLTHTLLVNIGDVALESVSLQTAGLQYINEFQPEPNYNKGKIIAEKLSEGIEKDNFIYRRGHLAVENSTFVLRSIAYGGKSFRAIQGITYNEFDFDDRRDITVAFRIVEKDADENVTILWKRLSEKKSPKVIWKKKNQKIPSKLYLID